MRKNLNKNYNPKEFENRIYENWEKSGAFKPVDGSTEKTFTIVMPPPNITGQLHMGHALDHTLQDVFTRYKRMNGYKTLWLPGSDHASIATEVKVVEKIRKEEGKTKEELGREAFLERAWAWKKEYGGKITKQCRKLGDSCDWSRERFTMDEGCNKAVKTFFVKLYEKGYIYRGNRLINWCPDCGTSLSDAEVEHVEKEGNYWYFRYPSADGKGDGIVVATSRPETMFGDVAIAVRNGDERYADIIGKNVILPIVGREIPVIEDSYPDPEKGTGAVKITPAHDPNDFEVGVRHKLESLSCIDEDGKMNHLAGKYEGMDRFECRKKWVADLEEQGYLIKVEKKEIPVGTCYRCGTVVEPMLSDQWFVAMKDLAKPAISAAKNGTLKHIPERFEKIYLHWLEDIRDWCISRQLWWGHRIPAWYCEDCGHITVSVDTPHICEKCNSKNIRQDEDVLDTWFSSALWPFSTMGWPEKTADLKSFFPTSMLVTGYDIIFFWVVRMVFASLEATGEIPFEHVYIHGLVRDELGRKMSKSLGNGIDPLEIIDEYGADALRFMLSTGITPGNDMRFKMDKLESARNFANKLWNASRFVIMNLQDDEGTYLPIDEKYKTNLEEGIYELPLKAEDRWILWELNNTIKLINKNIDSFDVALGGQKIYEFAWDKYCDWYIEFVKTRLWSDDEDDKKVARCVLVLVLKNILKLLHPFMPFITEEIWGMLPPDEDKESTGNFLISASWPKTHKSYEFVEEAAQMAKAMEVIKSIRNIRNQVQCGNKKLKAIILIDKKAHADFEKISKYIVNIGGLSELILESERGNLPADAKSSVFEGGEIFVPLDELMDFEEELDRLRAEENRLIGEVKRVEGKLSNKGFVDKAPANVVEAEKAKGQKYEEMLIKVREQIANIKAKINN